MIQGREEIRRAELKRLVSVAIGGGIAIVAPQSTLRRNVPSGPALGRLPQRPSPPAILLDAEWCMVSQGKYLTMMDLRERLRQGPLNFAWMGTQAGPGLFQPGIGLTLGQAQITPSGDLRAASTECVFDRSPLRFDPSLDRWKCAECGSAFDGRDGRVESTPAEKPLVTFSLMEMDGGQRIAMLPPNSKPPQ